MCPSVFRCPGRQLETLNAAWSGWNALLILFSDLAYRDPYYSPITMHLSDWAPYYVGGLLWLLVCLQAWALKKQDCPGRKFAAYAFIPVWALLMCFYLVYVPALERAGGCGAMMVSMIYIVSSLHIHLDEKQQEIEVGRVARGHVAHPTP